MDQNMEKLTNKPFKHGFFLAGHEKHQYAAVSQDANCGRLTQGDEREETKIAGYFPGIERHCCRLPHIYMELPEFLALTAVTQWYEQFSCHCTLQIFGLNPNQQQPWSVQQSLPHLPSSH